MGGAGGAVEGGGEKYAEAFKTITLFDNDIIQPIAIFLINPELPPSGVSTGHIYPHCVAFNLRGPIILTLESRGV